MTRFGWLVFLVVLVGISGSIGGWYLIVRNHPPVAAPQAVATTTPQEDLSSSSIYTNGVYGFSIVYPAKDAIAETFAPWRAGAVASGTPLVAFTGSDGSIRVGASKAVKEIQACAKPGPAETALAAVRLGTTTFKAFMHDAVGTDNQERITSYRAIHEKSCVAIESFQPLINGSVATSTGIADIIQSFSFARP